MIIIIIIIIITTIIMRIDIPDLLLIALTGRY